VIGSEALNLAGFAVLAFSLVFAYAGTLDRCTYRRYIVPLMLLVLAAIFWEETVAALMIAASAALFFAGYKGYGIDAKKKEESG
jgi:hypothetical protein